MKRNLVLIILLVSFFICSCGDGPKNEIEVLNYCSWPVRVDISNLLYAPLYTPYYPALIFPYVGSYVFKKLDDGYYHIHVRRMTDDYEHYYTTMKVYRDETWIISWNEGTGNYRVTVNQ